MEYSINIITVITGIIIGGLLTWIIGRRQLASLFHRLRDVIMDREYVSLKEEYLLTKMLADKIRKTNFKPDIIFAICPGGAMIAEWLSRNIIGDFQNPIPVRVINLSNKRSSDGVIAENVVVKEDLASIVVNFPKNYKILLVNDISRGGASLKAAHDFLSQYFEKMNILTASLFCHEDSRVKPIHFTIMTKKTIRFDWKER